jgi:hypothetical protein
LIPIGGLYMLTHHTAREPFPLQSDYDCFIDEVRADGTVLIDKMSFTWSICQDVARVAMTMVAQGRPLEKIQEHIDAKYATKQAYRTPAPLPPVGYLPPAR